jgi:uncharacterized protein YneR
MNIKIDDATYNAIENELKDRANKNKIRIFMSGIDSNGATFGLSVENATGNDLEDTSRDIKFLIEKDIYDSYGNFEIKRIERGYKVKPLSQVEQTRKCGAGCGGCESGCGCH